MAEDIVQKIVITAEDQATPTLDRIAKKAQQLGGQVAQSSAGFDQATKSIAALGSTGAEALNNVATAATKFGATQQQLQSVQNVITALAARARDSGTSFATLAQNYDKARASAGTMAANAAQVGSALEGVAAKAATVGTEV